MGIRAEALRADNGTWLSSLPSEHSCTGTEHSFRDRRGPSDNQEDSTDVIYSVSDLDEDMADVDRRCVMRERSMREVRHQSAATSES